MQIFVRFFFVVLIVFNEGLFQQVEVVSFGVEVVDVLFYEGLYGGVVMLQYNVVQYVDLLVGVVFIVNFEWI